MLWWIVGAFAAGYIAGIVTAVILAVYEKGSVL